MTTAAPVADPLRAFLSGKRATPRMSVSWPVRVSAPGVDFVGQAVDASEGGMLIGIDELRLPSGERLRGDALLLHLHDRLAGGFEVRLLDKPVCRDATPVRLGTRTGEGGMLYLGCSFLSPLTIREQRELGLLDRQRVVTVPAWREPVYLGSLPYVADKRRPAHVMAFDAESHVVGPRFVGTLSGGSGSALAVDVRVPNERAVFDLLGTKPVELEVLANGRSAWRGEGTPAAILLGDREDCVRIGVQLAITLPRAVRALLVPRAS